MFKKIRIVLIIASLLLFLFSGFKLINIHLDKKENRNIQEEINKSILNTDDKYRYKNIENKIQNNVLNMDNNYKYKNTTVLNSSKVNFKNLSLINRDTIGYIEVKNTNVAYVVVKTNDNKYYLEHNFYKESNSFGWIFADYRNKFDGTDKNIIIYGHNTETPDMFTTLENILSPEWYTNKENLYIPFSTEKENVMYKVFSIYIIKPEDYYIETDFTNNDFVTFIKVMKSRSIYDFKTEVKKSDTVLTLSTCYERGKRRLVLHAVRIS